MPTPIVFEDVAPVVPVLDLQAALERYRQLGFEVRALGARHGIRLRSAGSRINSSERVGRARPQAHRRGHLSLCFRCRCRPSGMGQLRSRGSSG
jgi:hypothetical protein